MFYLPPGLDDELLRRSALAAHLGACLELARDGVIELSQAARSGRSTSGASDERRELGKRIVEALLFAAEEPLEAPTIQAHLPGGLQRASCWTS